MNIRAKFKVIDLQPQGEEHTSINLMMTVLSHVLEGYEIGQEYYVSLELAE